MITLQEEIQLIDRILAGERELYAKLVHEYKGYAYTIALKILENRPEAEEAAQDGFIKAFHYLKGFNREAKFSTWLYRIVFNTAISYKRKNRQQFQSIENSIVEYSVTADRQLEKDDKQVFVGQAMNKLNEADKLAIQLYYIKEFSLEEVAEMMGQNENTIKVRIHRARQRLADELKKNIKRRSINFIVMERITQKQDDQLLQYLDGTLATKDKTELETQLAKNANLELRLAELRNIHSMLGSKARLEQPSKLFTDKVMLHLDRLPRESTISPRNGLLLLFGILVAAGAMVFLLTSGVFDNLNDTISFEKLPLKNDFIKNSLPNIPFNGKWMVNSILLLTMGLAFVLLDRTILKPYFDKRSRMQF